MLKRIVAILLLASFLFPRQAQARAAAAMQTPLTFDSVSIRLWPEFDRPTMLVIYDIALPQGTPLPTFLTFRIPATVGEPNGYGYYVSNQDKPVQDREGYLYEGSGDWATVTFRVNSLRATLEYYDPALSKDGSARHFEYLWPADYPTSALDISIQEPASAENMRLSGDSQKATETDGLTYYHLTLGPRTAGETYRLTIDYERSTDRLSVENMQVQPVYPLPAPNPLRLLPWLLAVLGGILLLGGVGVYWYLQSGHANPLFASKSAATRGQKHPFFRRRHRSSPLPESALPPPEDGIYCHQCGKRAGVGDRFCRSCGTQLRAE